MIPETDIDLVALKVKEEPSYTYSLDTENNRIRGMTDGKDAVRQAAYLILSTERYRDLIHSWNYGVELQNLIGKSPDYAYPEIKRRIQEALKHDDRIISVYDFVFKQTGHKVYVTFTVESTFGGIDMEVYV